MNTRFAYLLLLFATLVTLPVTAQYIQVNDAYTAQQLVEDILINNDCASISNVSVSGGAFANNARSYGYFNGNGSTFPFKDGIILSTGRALGAIGPNESLLDDGGGIDWGGDQDLDTALDIRNSVNATVLEFDFIPLANKISFEYMLASEEYHDTAPCKYSDGFAFLLKETGSSGTYENLAIVPGTNIPVKVTSVHPLIPGGCEAQNEAYFGAFNGREYPTNFNGQTKVMTAVANVTPGTQYHIKLVIADEGNYRYDSAIFLGGGSFNATTFLGADRLLATENPLCDGEVFKIDATTPNATGYQWYKDGTIINGATSATYTVDPSTTAIPGGTYTVDIKFTSTCIALGKIILEYADPVTFGTYTILQCDDNNDGLTTYYLDAAAQLATGYNRDLRVVAYYTSQTNADNNTNPITNADAFKNTVVNQPIYILIQNQYGCQGIATVILSTSSNTVNNASLAKCDEDGTDDGFTIFDLTDAEAEILAGLPSGLTLSYYNSYANALTYTNAVSNPISYVNSTSGGNIVYARINSGSDCYGIAQVRLTVYSFGNTLTPEDVILCDNSIVTLNAGSGFSSYSWNTTPVQTTQSIVVSTAGTYTVTVSQDHGDGLICTGTKSFNVAPSGPVTSAVIDIKDFKGDDNNSISITAEGNGIYEYSIDGLNYQDSPVFENLSVGEYKVYISDTNGCSPIYQRKIVILDYHKFFTPNADGNHDLWRIPYMNQRPGLSVIIYDRYGKIVTGFTGNSAGWDGTVNGRRLPATDYWFVINLENGRTVKGHFSLVR